MNSMSRIKYMLLVVLFSNSIMAQTKSIQGLIIDDMDFEGQCSVGIYINDTTKIGETSWDGTFNVILPIENNEIELRGPSVYPTKIILNNFYREKIDVIMLSLSNYCFSKPRKAEKTLKQRFKKIPILYRKAYYKGIFSTRCPNYEQVYIPFYTDTKEDCSTKKQ
jgi:hypothetical protein